MKKSTVLRNGLWVFLLAQISAFLIVRIWLLLDKTDYGFGGGILMLLLYLVASIGVSVAGIIWLLVRYKKYRRQYLWTIPEIALLHMFLPFIFYMVMSFFLLDFKNQLQSSYDTTEPSYYIRTTQ